MITSLSCRMFDNFSVGGSGISDEYMDTNGQFPPNPFDFKYDLILDETYIIAPKEFNEAYMAEDLLKEDNIDPYFLMDLKDEIFSRNIQNFPELHKDKIIGFVNSEESVLSISNNSIVYHNEKVSVPNWISSQLKINEIKEKQNELTTQHEKSEDFGRKKERSEK